MAELYINGATYRVARRMDALKQSNVLFKIMPLLASGVSEFIPLVIELRNEGFNGIEDLPMDRLGKLLVPVARELAKISGEDQKFVYGACLEHVIRKDDNRDGWAPVWNSEAHRAMFDDINTDLFTLIRIVMFVIQETFTSFFSVSLLSLKKEALQ